MENFPLKQQKFYRFQLMAEDIFSVVDCTKIFEKEERKKNKTLTGNNPVFGFLLLCKIDS